MQQKGATVKADAQPPPLPWVRATPLDALERTVGSMLHNVGSVVVCFRHRPLATASPLLLPPPASPGPIQVSCEHVRAWTKVAAARQLLLHRV
jgi:hypothetical protein